MQKIGNDKVCYAMSARNKPVAEVKPGECFTVATEDCYGGRLRTKHDIFTKEMWDTVNPATGPILVQGAQPGAILRIDVKTIKVRNHAVMCVERKSGALGDFIEGVETTIIPIRQGRLNVRSGLAIPLRPMIGVIGTAPRKGVIPNGTPGEHGGNMDCREITAGSSVYLPVNVPGALLCLGDLHALMGDGEVCICGAEVAGEITLRTALVHSFLPTPCVRTRDGISFIGSAGSLDTCERIVLGKAHRFLTGTAHLKPNEAARLMSLAGTLGVCQVVDPLKTMRFSLPLCLLSKLGVRFPVDRPHRS